MNFHDVDGKRPYSEELAYVQVHEREGNEHKWESKENRSGSIAGRILDIPGKILVSLYYMQK